MNMFFSDISEQSWIGLLGQKELVTTVVMEFAGEGLLLNR